MNRKMYLAKRHRVIDNRASFHLRYQDQHDDRRPMEPKTWAEHHVKVTLAIQAAAIWAVVIGMLWFIFK